MRLPAFVYLSVCIARLLKYACMDLDEMLRVNRCRDMDELINFSARYRLQSGCRNRIAVSNIVCAAMRNFITSGKSNVQLLGARSCSEPWFLKMVLFTASLWNTSVGGKCALPSAVLFLKQFRLGASTVSCSKLFHLLMTRFEKKYFIRVKSYKFPYYGHVINPYHNIIIIKRE